MKTKIFFLIIALPMAFGTFLLFNCTKQEDDLYLHAKVEKGWNFWRFSGSQSPALEIMTEEWTTTPNSRIIWSGSR